MNEILTFRTKYAKLTRRELLEKIKTEHSFRQELESLYERATGLKLNKSCSDCWMDAYIVLMTIKEITTMKEKNFELKAGALLIDIVGHDNDKLCTRHNLTDELALYHLRTNPACKNKFSKLPENLDELLAAEAAAASEKQEQEPTDGEGQGAAADGGSNAPVSEDDSEDDAEHAETLKAAKNAVSQAKRNLSTWQKKHEEALAAEVKDEKRIAETTAKIEAAEKLLEEAQEALAKLEA